MKIKRRTLLFSFWILLIIMCLPTRLASANDRPFEGGFDGTVFFGQSFTVKSGEIKDEDLVVIGGTLTIEQNAKVQGDVAVVGGSLYLDGEVDGDVAMIGGTVHLGATAHITGDLAFVGGSLQRAEGAQVEGDILHAIPSQDMKVIIAAPFIPDNIPAVPGLLPEIPKIFFIPPWRRTFGVVMDSVAFGVLAMLLMLFLVTPAERVARFIISQPLVSGGAGLLVVLVVPLAIVLMAVTLLLIPAIPILVLLLVAALVFGWIVIGYEVGQRITQALKWNWHPCFAAGLGTFLLTVTSHALANIPGLNCVGWLVPTLVGLTALGGVVITGFGLRSASSPSLPSPLIDPGEPEK